MLVVMLVVVVVVVVVQLVVAVPSERRGCGDGGDGGDGCDGESLCWGLHGAGGGEGGRLGIRGTPDGARSLTAGRRGDTSAAPLPAPAGRDGDTVGSAAGGCRASAAEGT
eukprot:gene45720-56539_t